MDFTNWTEDYRGLCEMDWSEHKVMALNYGLITFKP